MTNVDLPHWDYRMSKKLLAILMLIAWQSVSYAEEDEKTHLRSSKELAALNAIILRHEKLRSLIVDYERIDIQMSNMTAEQIKREKELAGGKVRIITGTEMKECRFQFLDGMRRYDWTTKLPFNRSSFGRQIHSFHDDRLERLLVTQGGRRIGNKDTDFAWVSASSFRIDLATGLRFCQEHNCITHEDMRGFDVELIDENLVVLRTNRRPHEQVSEFVHHWTYDKRFRYALVTHQMSLGNKFGRELSMENFQDWDGVYLPGFITDRATRTDERRHTSPRYFRITNYRLNDPENTKESFAIDWPEKTAFVRQPRIPSF